jgi:hypothetical protein
MKSYTHKFLTIEIVMQIAQNQFGGRSLRAVDLTDPAPALPTVSVFFLFIYQPARDTSSFLLFNFITTHPSFFSHVRAH